MRRALAKAAESLGAREIDLPALRARLTDLRSPNRERAVAGAETVFSKWLETLDPQQSRALENELLNHLVPLEAAGTLWRMRPPLPLRQYRAARAAVALRRLCTTLAAPPIEHHGRGRRYLRDGRLVPPAEDDDAAWTEAAIGAGASTGDGLTSLLEFRALKGSWKTWLRDQLQSAFTKRQRREVARRLLSAHPLRAEASQHPWPLAIAFARWVLSSDGQNGKLEALLPTEFPAEVLRLAGRHVRIELRPVSFTGPLEEAQLRGAGLPIENRSVTPAQRDEPVANVSPMTGVRVGPIDGSLENGRLFRESCEVSIGVIERRFVFLTTSGRRLDLAKERWRWDLTLPPVEGVLGGWAVERGKTRLQVKLPGAPRMSVLAQDVFKLRQLG